MIPKPLFYILFAVVFGLQINIAQDVSITQAKTGKTINIEVVGVASGVLTFKMSGKEFKIPVSQLTPESVQKLRDHLAKAPSPAASGKPPEATASFIAKAAMVNDIIGHELFGSSASIWTEDSQEVAGRLNWKLESRKKDTSSYRRYPKLDYTFLGTHPYCATLYGGNGNLTERLSLVFANKGDFGSRLGMGENHFKLIHPDRKPPGDLEEAIEIDEEVITKNLTKALRA